MRTAWLTALLGLALASCSGTTNIPIEGCAACKPDGGKADAGGKSDAGRMDAGPADAGSPDAGPPDAGVDAGPDAGPDAGADAGLPLTGNVCPGGPDGGNNVLFFGQVSDLCADQSERVNVPLPGVQVATLEPYSAALTDSNGNYAICVQLNVPFTLAFSLANYVTTYEAEFTVQPGYPPLPPLVGNMEMVCSGAFTTYAEGDPLMDVKKAAVYSAMISVTMAPPCDDPDAGFAGWSFQATLPDGGIGPGGPWPSGYFDDSGDLQLVSSTFDDGRAFMYNIDPSVGYVSVEATDPAIPTGCEEIDVDIIGFTGRVFVASGSFSFYPWVVH